jgi:hypothetical protein
MEVRDIEFALWNPVHQTEDSASYSDLSSVHGSEDIPNSSSNKPYKIANMGMLLSKSLTVESFEENSDEPNQAKNLGVGYLWKVVAIEGNEVIDRSGFMSIMKTVYKSSEKLKARGKWISQIERGEAELAEGPKVTLTFELPQQVRRNRAPRMSVSTSKMMSDFDDTGENVSSSRKKVTSERKESSQQKDTVWSRFK